MAVANTNSSLPTRAVANTNLSLPKKITAEAGPAQKTNASKRESSSMKLNGAPKQVQRKKETRLEMLTKLSNKPSWFCWYCISSCIPVLSRSQLCYKQLPESVPRMERTGPNQYPYRMQSTRRPANFYVSS
jgi:hypothetical protein